MYQAAQLAGARGTYQMGAALSRQRVRRRLSHLSAITPDQAAQIAMPKNTIKSTAGFTQAVYNQIVQSAQNLQLASPLPASCGTSPSVSLKPAIMVSAGAIGMKLAPLTGPAAPFVALGSALVGLFGTLFASHAAKVAKEQQVECAAMPAANDGLTAIYQAVQNGTLSPSDGKAALAQLQTEFAQTVSSILKSSSSACNAACVLSKQLKAAIAEMSSQFDDMAAAAAQQAAANPVGAALSPISSAIAGAGLPSWVLPAAGFFVLWKLL
jgi:hypothetical protein